jgi:hypothetical protein
MCGANEGGGLRCANPPYGLSFYGVLDMDRVREAFKTSAISSGPNRRPSEVMSHVSPDAVTLNV